ncbi:MAG TPA: hypothetical protein VGH15_13235 [Caulobacteraceae bacterium]|jgi:hypothetical protein
MNSRTISSTGYVGYALKSNYDQLTILSTGAIGGATGGTALTVQYTASVENHGSIVGGAGANGGPVGGDAGAAVLFAVAGSLTNYGVIVGGAGGSGGAGEGGSGATGVELDAGGGILNVGTIAGGAGGPGSALAGSPGYGIVLAAGGAVRNYGAVTGRYGVYLNYLGSTAASITNWGVIHGSGGGVLLGAAGSSLYNQVGGSIYGKLDGAYLERAGTITNDGTITSALKGAIAIAGNSRGGTITVVNNGFVHGAFGITVAGTGEITNSATVTAVYKALTDGAGTVINKAGGKITGGTYGVILYGDGTLINYGHISSSSYAVQLNTAASRMIMEPGSSVTGQVRGGGGTLELAAGTITSSVALGASISGFGAYQIDAGASWRVSGTATSLGNAGTLSILANSVLVASDLTNSGLVKVTGGTGKAFAGLLFSGLETLSGGGAISLNATGYISGVLAGDSLTNLDNTIEGGGFIKGPLTLTNEGTIDDNVGRMLVNTGNTIINDGLIESGGSGTLLVRNTTIDSLGGGTVVDGKKVQLDNSTLRSGALTISAHALLQSVIHGGTVNLGGGTVVNLGTVEGGTGGLIIDGDVANSGLVQGFNGVLTITGNVTGAGNARVFGSGTLEVDGTLGESVFFAASSTGTLILNDPTAFTGKVYGFSLTGKTHIDLKNITFNASDTASFKGTKDGGVLTLKDGSNAVITTVKLAGNYTASTFTLSNGGADGTVITGMPKTTTLTSAMAAFGTAGSSSTATATHPATAPPALSTPH